MKKHKHIWIDTHFEGYYDYKICKICFLLKTVCKNSHREKIIDNGGVEQWLIRKQVILLWKHVNRLG